MATVRDLLDFTRVGTQAFATVSIENIIDSTIKLKTLAASELKTLTCAVALASNSSRDSGSRSGLRSTTLVGTGLGQCVQEGHCPRKGP